MNNASKGHCVTVTPQGNKLTFLVGEDRRINEIELGVTESKIN